MKNFNNKMNNEIIESNYQNNGTLSLYYGIRLLVLATAGVFFWWSEIESGISTMLIFAVMFIPSILKNHYRMYLPFALDLGVIVLLFVTLFLGQIGNFYENVPFWDKFVHFQSGILLGVAGYVLIFILNENKKLRLDLSPLFIAVFAVTFSLTMGVVWEIAEFSGDAYWGSQWQINNADTMWDLISDGIGSLLASIAGYYWMSQNNRIPFTPRFLKIFRKKEEK